MTGNLIGQLCISALAKIYFYGRFSALRPSFTGRQSCIIGRHMYIIGTNISNGEKLLGVRMLTLD